MPWILCGPGAPPEMTALSSKTHPDSTPPAGEHHHLFTATPAHIAYEEHHVATQMAISHHYWVMDEELKNDHRLIATSGPPSRTWLARLPPG